MYKYKPEQIKNSYLFDIKNEFRNFYINSSREILIKKIISVLSTILFVLILFLPARAEDVSKITKPRFVMDKDKKTIKLLNADGNIVKSIELKHESKVKNVAKRKAENTKVKETEPERQIEEINEVKGNISEDGQYMAIITHNVTHAGTTLLSFPFSEIQYIDTNNEILWKKQNVDVRIGVDISQDGERMAFLESIIEDIDHSPPEVKQWIIVCNKKGEELLKIGPYVEPASLFLTKNGRFGYLIEYNFICFNVDSKEIYILERTKVPDGWIDLSEEGMITVEKGRKIYLDGKIEKGEITHTYKFK